LTKRKTSKLHKGLFWKNRSSRLDDHHGGSAAGGKYYTSPGTTWKPLPYRRYNSATGNLGYQFHSDSLRPQGVQLREHDPACLQNHSECYDQARTSCRAAGRTAVGWFEGKLPGRAGSHLQVTARYHFTLFSPPSGHLHLQVDALSIKSRSKPESTSLSGLPAFPSNRKIGTSGQDWLKLRLRRLLPRLFETRHNGR